MPSPEPGSLKQRVLNAGAWAISSYVLNMAIRLGSNLYLTRQLVPEMFGVMGIASMILTGLAMFSDLGLKQSVVSSPRGSIPSFLNTAWSIQICRGFLLWLFALTISLSLVLLSRFDFVPKDSVYSNPSLPLVFATLSFVAVIAGFDSTKLLEASRNLSLSSITKIEIAAQIAALVAMIVWVQFDKSIAALVAGPICGALVRTLLSHATLPGSPNRWRLDRGAVREILHFGKWIFLSSILGFFVINADRLLLGLFVSADILGIYLIAFLMVNSIDQVLTKVIVDVSFPALGEIIRERPKKLLASYYRLHAIIASLTYFSCGMLFIFGQTLISFLYDRRYHDAGWMLEVLAVGLAAVPFRIATECFLALGAARVYSQLHVIRLVAICAFVPAGFHFRGLPGALCGIVLASYSGLPLTIIYARRFGLFDLRKEIWALPALLVGLGFGGLLKLISEQLR